MVHYGEGLMFKYPVSTKELCAISFATIVFLEGGGGGDPTKVERNFI
jgi:hypothetical protein